jgi:hypothetical protein
MYGPYTWSQLYALPTSLAQLKPELVADFPGADQRTDRLGRTGTAIQLGGHTMVVDPASGVVLDETDFGSTVMFVAQGPATSEPQLPAPAATPSVRPGSTRAAS